MVDRSILPEDISSIIIHIPHYTTLQKFTDRINGAILEKIISSFIILINIRQIFFGIDSSGFKAIRASQYYVEKTKLRRRRRKYVKLSVGADILQQIICATKIRRAPARHDNVDFQPIVERASKIMPMSVVVADKGYDRAKIIMSLLEKITTH
ncbi:MAG TPA: transposase [Nitrososphaeraceae archaeon]|nr:transposase [Nitrososphaeraceae archaeon]